VSLVITGFSKSPLIIATDKTVYVRDVVYSAAELPSCISENTDFRPSLCPSEDRLCGLVVRVSGYRYRGLGFDSRRYQIF
jgi:hypothetical protein